MFVDVDRNDVARTEPIRVVETAIDRVYLRLNRGFVRGTGDLARAQRTRVNECALLAFLRDFSRAAVVETRGDRLRLRLRRRRRACCVKIHQRDYGQANG